MKTLHLYDGIVGYDHVLLHDDDAADVQSLIEAYAKRLACDRVWHYMTYGDTTGHGWYMPHAPSEIENTRCIFMPKGMHTYTAV